MKTRDELYEAHNRRLNAIQSRFDCNCIDLVMSRREVGERKVITVWMQCQRCGRGVRSVKKNGIDLDSLPQFDEDRKNVFQELRNEAWQEERDRFAKDLECFQEDSNREWWQTYSAYLHSRQWHVLRKKVLERDGDICQACLTRKATQVHHLSYDLFTKIGSSAAFECVAICYQCHVKIHPDMAQAQHNLVDSGHNPYLNGVQYVR